MPRGGLGQLLHADVDQTHTILCREDSAIPALVLEWPELPPEPELKLPSDDEIGEGALHTARADYVSALHAWETAKADKLIEWWRSTPYAAILGEDFAAFDGADKPRTEVQAKALLQGLAQEARWRDYCCDGDESKLQLLDDAEPARFVLHLPSTRDLVSVKGTLEQADVRRGPQDVYGTVCTTEYEVTYSALLWLCGRCVVNVIGWPDHWPALQKQGKHVSQDSLSLLPASWITALGTYAMQASELRKPAKKA